MVEAFPAGLGVEANRGDSAPGGLGPDVQASVPDSDDQVRVADCQRAGQMDSVGSAQGVGSGEAPGVLLNRRLGGEKFDEGAGVEVDERHQISAAGR